MHRALKGLKGESKSWPATKAQNVRWTQGRMSAVRNRRQSSRGMQQNMKRHCLASMGEERSVQGLLRAKEAETGNGGAAAAGGGGVFEVVLVPAAAERVEIAAAAVVAFLSITNTLAEASGIASAIIVGRVSRGDAICAGG